MGGDWGVGDGLGYVCRVQVGYVRGFVVEMGHFGPFRGVSERICWCFGGLLGVFGPLFSPKSSRIAPKGYTHTFGRPLPTLARFADPHMHAFTK